MAHLSGGPSPHLHHPTGRDLLLERIAAARALHGETPPAPLVRAVENLKLALRLRVARGDLSEEQVRELATTIDAAATAVERS